jgi:Vacuolar-sorting-associated 13 protein C-terminal
MLYTIALLQEMRPEELFVGMARGGGSLLKHTVGGVAHSFSQITGTFSKNLSTLSMDRDYKVTVTSHTTDSYIDIIVLALNVLVLLLTIV